ncbi:MAG TPA: DUF2949 domain-containing protein [Elainellaceae cyanobacterium]
MSSPYQTRLINFLQDELAIPSEAIAMALRRTDTHSNLLPVVLWQYGLITIEQLDQVFDWLEAV